MTLATRDLNLYYGTFWALKHVDLTIAERRITAIIGPSGCGKSTLVRVFNRMNDLIAGARITGAVLVDGTNIYAPGVDLISLRKKVGMVFQRPNVFPLSVWENVTFGPHVHGTRRGLGALVEDCLTRVHLWDELRTRLDRPALDLTLEQQQRLCIARLLAVRPEVLLMDEPCSALDPVATAAIEELMRELKNRYTIVIVTHNMQQAARVSDDTIYMLLGELIEHGPTETVFTRPRDPRTEDYLTGRFG